MQNKMCRLVSGEIIIAATDEAKNTETETMIETPMVVHFAPAPNGQLGINLFPLNPFAVTQNEEVMIKNEHIMFWIAEVHEDIQKQYIEISTGITLATKEKVSAPTLEIVTP